MLGSLSPGREISANRLRLSGLRLRSVLPNQEVIQLRAMLSITKRRTLAGPRNAPRVQSAKLVFH